MELNFPKSVNKKKPLGLSGFKWCRELYRADKEVKQIADGYYDGQIWKYENGYDGGMSR